MDAPPVDRYNTSTSTATEEGENDMRGRRSIGLAGALLILAVTSHAQESTFATGGVSEVLKARVGKPVTLHLESGATLTGNVAEVRDQAVVLKGLSGREFSDAIVRLDVIEAIEARAR
jgi:hypothetical protein